MVDGCNNKTEGKLVDCIYSDNVIEISSEHIS